MEKLKYLYYFSSQNLSVVEIKRLDQAPDAPPSAIYKWLVVKDGVVHGLSFKSMNKKEHSESREFLEGEIHFDQTGAEFKFQGKGHKLSRENADSVTEEIKAKVQTYAR